MKLYHDLEQWLSWVDELSANDYVIIDQFIRQDMYADVSSFFLSNLSSFSKAGIGTAEDNTIRHDIRGDHTYWLDRKRDTSLQTFWDLVDESIQVFNRYCYLSLSGYEFHLANYPPTAHYEKHLDQFNNRSNRLITVVIYLNENWKKEDGGELEMFLKDGSTKIVEPIAGRCVLFKSAEVPHQVLTSKKDRHSLTGWLLRYPSALGHILG